VRVSNPFEREQCSTGSGSLETDRRSVSCGGRQIIQDGFDLQVRRHHAIGRLRIAGCYGKPSVELREKGLKNLVGELTAKSDLSPTYFRKLIEAENLLLAGDTASSSRL